MEGYDFRELKGFVKEKLKEGMMPKLIEGLTPIVRDTLEVINGAVDSAVSHIEDEVQLEEYARIARLAATDAACRAKKRELDERLNPIIEAESKRASEALNKVFAEAVKEAIEELTGQKIGGD